MSPIPARLGLQQRVLAGYRVPFFNALAAACPRGLAVFAGEPLAEEAIESGKLPPAVRFYPARNRYILGGKFRLCWQAGLLGWLEDWQPEVLILEANPRYLHNPAASGWMHRRGKKVIGWGLGAAQGGGIRTLWRRAYLKQFDALLTYSHQGVNDYTKLGFPKMRIFTALNASTPRPQTPPPARPTGFAQGRATLLFVGRLQARKRLDLLLQACAALPPEQQPNLHIVGDGPERVPLEQLASQVYPAARFFGAVYGEELDPFFAAADLFVLPGTGGLAVQQAMAHALPIAAAEADGTQADLVRAENGWRIPPGDSAALAEILRHALADAGRLRRMGMESFRIVCEEANLENMTAVFEQAVKSVWDG